MDKMYKSATQGKSNSSNIAGYIKTQWFKFKNPLPIITCLPAGWIGTKI